VLQGAEGACQLKFAVSSTGVLKPTRESIGSIFSLADLQDAVDRPASGLVSLDQLKNLHLQPKPEMKEIFTLAAHASSPSPGAEARDEGDF
jgi:hypothetical protein